MNIFRKHFGKKDNKSIIQEQVEKTAEKGIMITPETVIGENGETLREMITNAIDDDIISKIREQQKLDHLQKLK
jgi:hypothetical protein